ncbi:MAG: hypothetical protein VZR27_04655 [Acutalibacteraceae bacterium]|nr:hypothetical protein [Acutalibacteraceae bacterium]
MNKYIKLLSAFCVISLGMCGLSGCGSKPSDNISSAASYRGVFSAPGISSKSDDPSGIVWDESEPDVSDVSFAVSSEIEESSKAASSRKEESSKTTSSKKDESSKNTSSNTSSGSDSMGIQRNEKNYFNEMPQLPQPDYLPGVVFSNRNEIYAVDISEMYFYKYKVDPSLKVIDVLKLYGDELEQIDFETYDDWLDYEEEPMISLSESRGDKEIIVHIYPDDIADNIIDITINTFFDSTVSSSEESSSAASSMEPAEEFIGFWLKSYIIDKDGDRLEDDSADGLYFGFGGVFNMKLSGEKYTGTWEENDDGIVMNFNDETNSVAYGKIIYGQNNNYLEIRFKDAEGAFGYVKD